MGVEQLIPVIIPALGVIGAAWIGLRPKRADPDELAIERARAQSEEMRRMGEEMKRMSERIITLESTVSTHWSTIQQLRAKIDSLGSSLTRLKAWVRRLEREVAEATGHAPTRPEDIEKIMEE